MPPHLFMHRILLMTGLRAEVFAISWAAAILSLSLDRPSLLGRLSRPRAAATDGKHTRLSGFFSSAVRWFYKRGGILKLYNPCSTREIVCNICT